jgi:hypothetical protein
MMYAIEMHNRFTGQSIYLGSKYRTRAEAEEAAKRDVCPRCNHYTVYAVPKDAQYIGRNHPLSALGRWVKIKPLKTIKRDVRKARKEAQRELLTAS